MSSGFIRDTFASFSDDFYNSSGSSSWRPIFNRSWRIREMSLGWIPKDEAKRVKPNEKESLESYKYFFFMYIRNLNIGFLSIIDGFSCKPHVAQTSSNDEKRIPLKNCLKQINPREILNEASIKKFSTISENPKEFSPIEYTLKTKLNNKKKKPRTSR